MNNKCCGCSHRVPGYVQLDCDGHIMWNTFRTTPPDEDACGGPCDIPCGGWMFVQDLCKHKPNNDLCTTTTTIPPPTTTTTTSTTTAGVHTLEYNPVFN